MSYIDGAATAGAELLDQKRPSWYREVGDPDTLDIADPMGCVLGRLYGNYRLGLDVLGVLDAGYCAADYGFNAWGDEPDEYRALSRDWSRLITERLTTGQ